MKDVLEGRTILIGKEPDQGRLLIAVKGVSKVATIGQIGSVPNSVSRCKPAEGIAHCQIEVDAFGGLKLTNLKAQNVTYVNGAEFMWKQIDQNTDSVALGKDKYVINVKEVLDTARKLFGETFDISPLKDVWDDYSASLKKIKIRQKHIGLLSSIPIAFTMLGGLIAGVAPEIRPFALIFTGIAFVVMLIGLYLRFTDKSIEETEKLNDKFQDRYVCPNPKCHQYLGNTPYKLLRQKKNCPSCKCQWTEE